MHYVPHHPVIRESAESTKTRIVYDCSFKARQQLPSLNDCLEKSPALQPLLFDILLRNRLKKLCVTGDIEKVFHQIRVHEEDRDALKEYFGLTNWTSERWLSIALPGLSSVQHLALISWVRLSRNTCQHIRKYCQTQ